jgi:hypothetical protein
MRILRSIAGALLWIVAAVLGLVAVLLCITIILLPGWPATAGRFATRVWNGGPADASTRGGSSGEADPKAVTRSDRRGEQPDQEVQARQGHSQSRTEGPQADQEVATTSACWIFAPHAFGRTDAPTMMQETFGVYCAVSTIA